MRTKVAKQILPVEMAEGSLELSKSIGPLVVMSGYLTKKARSMKRWLHRWFQLLDNGILQYYQNDKKEKMLGEIDIGRTCYDVRQGTKNCGISFPTVAPRCCCFWFTVLKRTYFMYAPTAFEARKWHESIYSASNILNRRVVAGVKRRKAPEAPGTQRGYKPSLRPLNYRISMTPWDMKGKHKRCTSLQDVHRIRVSAPDDSSDIISPIEDVSTFARATSVPDFLDRVGMISPLLSPDSQLNTQLWNLPMPANSTFVPVVAVTDESTNSSSQLNLVSTFHGRRRTQSLSESPSWRLQSLPGSITTQNPTEKKQLQRVCPPPRPASYHPRPQPRNRARHQAGAVQISPVNGVSLKSKLKSFSRSTEALYDSSSGESTSGDYRPIPKPRRVKETAESDITPPIPKRHSKVTFADAPNILNPTSPSGSDSSVSLSVLGNTIAVDIKDLPPPRPRKDSGPPKFVPPPPPSGPRPTESNNSLLDS
ncbi:uncharacterized protein LOC135341591 [Halichondria panicea]|uniref:uncharacterized protein LOC135341591 n=1 Tax=Halichondria panicea TaxID=6063 RepID=UPI00312B7BED